MRDRDSEYPGRIRLTPVLGEENIYDVEAADVPIDPGTPFNKATMLTDATAALMGLDDSATVDDMLSTLATRAISLNQNTNAINQSMATLTSKVNNLIKYGSNDIGTGADLETGTIYVVYK